MAECVLLSATAETDLIMNNMLVCKEFYKAFFIEERQKFLEK